MSANDRDYVRRLGEVLRRQDPAALREFLIEQASRFGDERQVDQVRNQHQGELEMLLHRMIVSRPDLADLHAESERWLAAHGQDPAPRPPGGGRRPAINGHSRGRRGPRRPRRPPR